MYPKLTTYADKRAAQASVAKMDAERDAAEITRDRIVREIKSDRTRWAQYQGYDINPRIPGVVYIVRERDRETHVRRDGSAEVISRQDLADRWD